MWIEVIQGSDQELKLAFFVRVIMLEILTVESVSGFVIMFVEYQSVEGSRLRTESIAKF